MDATHNNANITAKLKALLASRAKDFMLSGKVLSSSELMELYRQRYRIKPTQQGDLLILASMLYEKYPIRRRKTELGWFWFRRIHRNQLVEMLTRLAKSSKRSVRWPAANLLSIVTGKTSNGLTQSLPKLRRMAVNPAPAMRRAAIEVLAGHLQPEDAVVVRKLTRDPDKYVRYKATEVIGRYGQPEDRLWLLGIVGNKKHPDRSAAIISLAEFKQPADLPLFRKLTRDSEHLIRQKAALALGKLQHPDDVALLKKMALRRNAAPIDALMAYPAQIIVGTLHELADGTDSFVQNTLAHRLGDCRHPGAPKILRQLARAKNDEIKAAAAASLGVHGKAKDLPLLRRMCGSNSDVVRRDALWALGKFHKIQDAKLIEKSTWDESSIVRTVAAMALTRHISRSKLEGGLKENDQKMQFEALVESDFALYAPRWLARLNPRLGDDDIMSIELEMMRS